MPGAKESAIAPEALVSAAKARPDPEPSAAAEEMPLT
jgi:hypothetical protein